MNAGADAGELIAAVPNIISNTEAQNKSLFPFLFENTGLGRTYASLFRICKTIVHRPGLLLLNSLNFT